jgi:methyl coenzyme M reductase subunit D
MSLPNIAQCAAHLELLQAINHIRREVLNSSSLDAILDIKPQKRTVVQRYTRKTIEVKDNKFAQKRQVKWPFYLRLGVARFFVWLKKLDEILASNENEVLELPACPPLGMLSVYSRATAND